MFYPSVWWLNSVTPIVSLYIQLSNEWTVFVYLSKVIKVYDQLSIVKTVYVQLSDGWTV